ncbi:hypothetical protein NEOLEDRAFT_1053093 [Neolentinus lepideus HHB14362 ss-1]|uniref:Uncharacterized protein n=1 Tax=Neolentinus lepideus HHB14362 ss-1 TaxID=1314782 RepID=A0A165WBL3_9AGAM|nr:hypothetical protein NEOLEDRAFT_1053093 [Neolentinus lepideus HHB14362 ss-1]
MNGTFTKGKQSVFSILDRLKSPWSHPKVEGADSSPGAGSSNDGAQDEEVVEDDNSSVMLYGPLIPSPDTDSIVELAQSEVISLDDDDSGIASVAGDGEPPANGEPSQSHHHGWSWPQWPWPVSKGKGEKKVHVEKKVWVPSRTKISLQVMWWGYRIYLPPPVLQVLNDQKLAAAKRAAMFTTALKWLCDNIPVSILPIQLRPAAVLVTRLLPYVGYIGGFVAWSWSAIKSYDKGNGVVLTATWILCVALIPSTWEQNNPPTSPVTSPQAPGTTVPLPSD